MKNSGFSSADGAAYSSLRHVWETPQALFDEIDLIYGFTLDPCASDANAKCTKYYTIENDGLAQSWAGEIVFCNPPYGRDIKRWVAKAYRESQRGAVVVMLIPARTDTSYWHEFIFPHAHDIQFIKGRIKFEVDGKSQYNAPFPSALVVFKEEA